MTSPGRLQGYAAGTSVPVERSKVELDTLLGKHGAGQRGIMHDEAAGTAHVVFVLKGLKYKLELPMPTPADLERQAPRRAAGWSGWTPERRQAWVRRAWEQACRERWRGVVLLIKAKLEIVRMGVSTFEREFLADLMLPDGKTAHQTIAPYMRAVLADGYTVLADEVSDLRRRRRRRDRRGARHLPDDHRGLRVQQGQRAQGAPPPGAAMTATYVWLVALFVSACVHMASSMVGLLMVRRGLALRARAAARAPLGAGVQIRHLRPWPAQPCPACADPGTTDPWPRSTGRRSKRPSG